MEKIKIEITKDKRCPISIAFPNHWPHYVTIKEAEDIRDQLNTLLPSKSKFVLTLNKIWAKLVFWRPS